MALAVGAVAAALVFGDILRTTTGHFVADAVNLAYPAGDFVLLMFVAMGYVLVGRRAGREWLALGSGVALMAVADILYAEQSTGGIYVSSDWVNVLYLASFSLLAVTAWLPSSREAEAGTRRRDTVVLTFVAAATALGLLVFAAFTTVTPLAVGFAAGALALGTVRSGLTYRENLRILRETSLQAVTDALTGLGNRRQLITDLGGLFGGDQRSATLLFFDLNGFKRYNDTYGHAAGDALLVRLAVAFERRDQRPRLGLPARRRRILRAARRPLSRSPSTHRERTGRAQRAWCRLRRHHLARRHTDPRGSGECG